MPEEAGLQLPAAWPVEVEDIAAQGYRVARLRGRLTAAGMAEDLAFVVVPEDQVPRVGNVIWREVPCDRIDGDTETARAPLRPWVGAGVLGLAGLLSLGLLRRIRG